MKNDIAYKENTIVRYAIYIEIATIVGVIVLLFICRINEISVLEVILKLITNSK